MPISIKDLQEFIRSKDHAPDRLNDYFYKLIEEIGELSKSLYKGKRMVSGNIKAVSYTHLTLPTN